MQKPRNLIKLFRDTIEKRLIDNGDIFRYTNNGNLTFKAKAMSEYTKEYDRLKDFINTEFEQNTSNYGIEPLDTTYNGIKSVETADENDSDAQIIALTKYHNKVIINEEKGIEHGYIPQLITSLRQQCQKAVVEIEELRKENATLEKKTKQYKWVKILYVTIITSLVCLYTQNDTICNLESALENRNKCINLLQDTLSNVRSDLSTLEQEFPIRISSIEFANTYQDSKIETDFNCPIYSSNTMFLKPRINYIGIDVGKNIDLKIKWYKPDGSLSIGDSSPKGFSQKHLLHINSKHNTQDLSGWGNSQKGYWEKGTYRFEIWYNDVCLKTKTLTIK